MINSSKINKLAASIFHFAHFQIPSFDIPPLFPPTLKHLDFSSCYWAVDNSVMTALGQNCPALQYLDIQGCHKISDIGIQNLVFPAAILRCGQVNLADPRIRTNPLTRHLRVKKVTKPWVTKVDNWVIILDISYYNFSI